MRNCSLFVIILMLLTTWVVGCGENKKAPDGGSQPPAVQKNEKPGEGDSSGFSESQVGKDGAEPGEGEAGQLSGDDMSLAGISLGDHPEKIRKLWGTPDDEIPDEEDLDATIWRYRLEGEVLLDFLVNTSGGWILAIMAELPEGWAGGPIPDRSRIATPRNIKLGDTVDNLEQVYGPWIDAGDGYLYATEDLMVGLKFGITSGKISRMFLFVAD